MNGQNSFYNNVINGCLGLVYRENGCYEVGKNTLSYLSSCTKLPLFLHQTTDIVSFPRP